jgi:hypothetical protein
VVVDFGCGGGIDVILAAHIDNCIAYSLLYL